MSSPYPVIITDGLWRKSLSAIRALGKSGHEVHVLGGSWLTTGFWSRFTARRKLAPLASEDPDAFGAALIAYLKTFPVGSPPVLVPMEDPTLIWVSRHRAELQGLALAALPSDDALRVAEDKSLTLKLARRLGVPMPETFWPENADELLNQVRAHFATRDWVIKPVTGSGSKGIIYGAAAPSAALSERLKQHWQDHGSLLVQERIPATGRGVGASFLIGDQGEVLAEFLHERIRQYPVSGGPSTDRMSIHHPEIREWSLRLLRELQWKGVAMVEWKADPRDASFKLMEINPRFWGSLELAIRSGVDFPTLYARLARGEKPIHPQPGYPDGVRCRWMIPGEILRYVSSPRPMRESLLRFLSGSLRLAEEWDRRDVRGAIATFVCTFCLALNPKFWKYIRRG